MLKMGQIEPFPEGITQRLSSTTSSDLSILNILNAYSPGMSHLAPSTSLLQTTDSTVTIGQGAIRGESQLRYASFSCAYQIMSQHGPRATVRIQPVSTFSTTIPLLTYFISIDPPSLAETRTT